MCEIRDGERPGVKTIPLKEAVGMVLAHDITEIRQGEFKGRAFRKGHIVRKEDICHLQRLGKERLFVLNISGDEMHEDDAAYALSEALSGEGVTLQGEPKEGKINLLAARDGLLKVNSEVLFRFNMLGDVMCATLHSNTLVRKGQVVAGTRAIPLVVKRETVEKAVRIAAEVRREIPPSPSFENNPSSPLLVKNPPSPTLVNNPSLPPLVNNPSSPPFSKGGMGGFKGNGGDYRSSGVIEVKELKRPKAGIVITGNEVYYGRTEDAFAPVIRKKIAGFNGEIAGIYFAPDDASYIEARLRELVEAGANLLITTGGMSVDPDDVTRFAIRRLGVTGMHYGSAVLPGAMFLVAYLPPLNPPLSKGGHGGVDSEPIPILGIPACGMYHSTTIFDLVLPRLLAGEHIGREELAGMGHGGLCLNCKECRYPVCPFGKG